MRVFLCHTVESDHKHHASQAAPIIPAVNAFLAFLRATAYMLYRVYAIARPSVRLSDRWIIEKWLKLG